MEKGPREIYKGKADLRGIWGPRIPAYKHNQENEFVGKADF